MADWPCSSHQILLSSITSVELRKVVLLVQHEYHWLTFMLEVGAWALLGEELCGLVDRLRAAEYRHTLGVELRITGIGEVTKGMILPNFCRNLGKGGW